MHQKPDRANAADEGGILRHLVETGRLEGAAKGIARQVLARGEGTLSDRQEWVFHTQVRTKYLLRVCELCGDLIPLPEVMASWGNGGYCGSCACIRGDGGPAAG